MAAARPWRRGTEAMAHAHVVGESGSGGRVIQNKPFSRVRRPLSKNPNVSRHCEISQCSCRIARNPRELVTLKPYTAALLVIKSLIKSIKRIKGWRGSCDRLSKDHLLLSV